MFILTELFINIINGGGNIFIRRKKTHTIDYLTVTDFQPTTPHMVAYTTGQHLQLSNQYQ